VRAGLHSTSQPLDLLHAREGGVKEAHQGGDAGLWNGAGDLLRVVGRNRETGRRLGGSVVGIGQ
jgi:hypothetical protein